jgi:chemosensory pili system protein ChpA (sensor histidine kinase/response regulator)
MASPTANSCSKKKILVTDDNEVILKTLTLALQADGYEVATASSGSDTITRTQEFRPDLILLDLDFPPDLRDIGSNMEDGFTIMSWLRQFGGAAKTPFIIISGTDPKKYQERAEADGVVAFFQKPVDKARLLKVIRQTLEDHHPAPGH